MSTEESPADPMRRMLTLAGGMGVLMFIVSISAAIVNRSSYASSLSGPTELLVPLIVVGLVVLALVSAGINAYLGGNLFVSVTIVFSVLLGFALATEVQTLMGIRPYTDSPAVPVFLTYVVITLMAGVMAWLVGTGARRIFQHSSVTVAR